MITTSATLTFHIIYTPGSVHGLLPLVSTLLRHSTCHYRLVANGCSPDEIAYMEQYAEQSGRLSVTRLPGKQQMNHGVALTQLFARSTDPYFCFMDSDILAAGDFMAELQPLLADAAGVFSAWPLMVKEQEKVLQAHHQYIGGHHLATPTGVCLGGSYFAMYHRAALTAAMQYAPAGFCVSYHKQLPRATRSLLKRVAQERLFYDTGRLLNLILIDQGYLLRTLETDRLCHIGSYSMLTHKASQPPPASPSSVRTTIRGVAKQLVRAVKEVISGQSYRRWVNRQLFDGPPREQKRQRRREVALYFAALLQALAEGTTRPELVVLNDPELDPRIQRATDLLLSAWREMKT
jgi:hypothetical protein